MEKGATNGAFYCHITYQENYDTYTLRFLRDSVKGENCFLVISERIGLDIDQSEASVSGKKQALTCCSIEILPI